VSFLIEAFGAKNKSAEDAGSSSADESLRSSDKNVREPMWFEVLGVAPTASTDEIKAAYRKRVRQYHPDRVEGMGFELRQIAEQKMKQLNAAYDRALRGR
jgi:DnaJ-class molecular chaperone